MVGAKNKFSLHDSQDASTIHPVWFLLRYHDLKNQPGVPFNRRPLLQRLQRPDVQHRGCSIMFRHSTWTPIYHWWVQMVQAFGTKVAIEEPLCRCFWRWCCRPAVTNCRSETTIRGYGNLNSWGVGPPSFGFSVPKCILLSYLHDCTELCWRWGQTGTETCFLSLEATWYWMVLVEQKIANIRPQ